VSETRPRERGFIANTAELMSYSGPAAGKRKRSWTPAAHEVLRPETVTPAIPSSFPRSQASQSDRSSSVGSQPIPVPT
jgi:hypothetical protein